MVGFRSGLVIDYVTEYYTSRSNLPVRETLGDTEAVRGQRDHLWLRPRLLVLHRVLAVLGSCHSHCAQLVWHVTDYRVAVGNVTAAICKGFAIGFAILVSLALFGSFAVRMKVSGAGILNPWVFTRLLFGATMPYAFAAWTMKFVGTAVNDMVK